MKEFSLQRNARRGPTRKYLRFGWVVLLIAAAACDKPRIAITPAIVYAVPGQWFELDLHYRDKHGNIVRELNTIDGFTVALSVGPGQAEHDDDLANAVTRIQGVPGVVEEYDIFPVTVTVDAPGVKRPATATIFFVNANEPPPGDRFVETGYTRDDLGKAVSPTSLVISANSTGLWKNQFFRTAVGIGLLGDLRKTPVAKTERIGVLYEYAGANVVPSTSIWTDGFETYRPPLPAIRKISLKFWIAFDSPPDLERAIQMDVASASYDFLSNSVGISFEAGPDAPAVIDPLEIARLGLWPNVDPPECYSLFIDEPGMNRDETNVVVVERMPWDELKGWTCSRFPGRDGRIIFLVREYSPLTLTHELGHAMGLTYPRGHINAMPQFDRGNFMHSQLEDAYYFSVGQAYYMNVPATWSTGSFACLAINTPVFSNETHGVDAPC